jgi:hypothetical protein
LLVGMQIIVVTMELIVEVPPKTENRIILWSSYTTLSYTP